jgi:TorA maturation chaperone TorD
LSRASLDETFAEVELLRLLVRDKFYRDCDGKVHDLRIWREANGMTVHTHTSASNTKNEAGDPKRQAVVQAVGGALKPSDPIVASHPSASNLSRVRNRALSVEAVMDLEREILWPTTGNEQPVELDDVDASRAQEYLLLATLLSRPPDEAMLARISKLNGDGTPLGLAHLGLAQAAVDTSAERIAREYFTLFIGVGRGELLPYESYYLTGFLNERPLARLREDLRAYGIERAEEQTEPEDHAATLCEIMAGMASGQFPVSDRIQRQFFERHMGSWIGRFFADLECAEAAEFYRRLGRLGRLFMETEAEAFTLPA